MSRAIHCWGLTDVLSWITQETDKAVIDVEAQDDGIIGKILVCLFVYNRDLLVFLHLDVPHGRFRMGRRTFLLERSLRS